MPEETLLLDTRQTLQKIKRIAYEIYEENFQEEELVVAGIYDRGYDLAVLIKDELENICNIQITLVKITLDKSAPLQSEIKMDQDITVLQGKNIILTDDVLNTGRTFAYSLKPFLTCEIKKLQTAVMVERNHKNFPISADFVGYALSTTLQEHIRVELKDKASLGVYIS